VAVLAPSDTHLVPGLRSVSPAGKDRVALSVRGGSPRGREGPRVLNPLRSEDDAFRLLLRVIIAVVVVVVLVVLARSVL